jgi:hypothetical protein
VPYSKKIHTNPFVLKIERLEIHQTDAAKQTEQGSEENGRCAGS